jgi:hypothetical protein
MLVNDEDFSRDSHKSLQMTDNIGVESSAKIGSPMDAAIRVRRAGRTAMPGEADPPG